MATYNQVNKSTNIVSVGRTAPVPRGQQPANKSLPVVLASDSGTIPVAEQNKVLSEVALSLLGIPRSEVALGIFADVNTYDVNPSEWSIDPIDKRTFTTGERAAGGIRPFAYEEDSTDSNTYNWGLTHVPEEAGAMIEAPPGETAILTSKRFFRYQPGRVSSATFGVKSSANAGDPSDSSTNAVNRNPAIRKYGIYDKFDGYYWETRGTGQGDEFSVARRTQSIIDFRDSYTNFNTTGQTTDYGIVGKGKEVATEVFESIMNSPVAYSITDGTIILKGANASRTASFKNGNIPQIGMTIQNITVSRSSASPMGPGPDGSTDTFSSSFGHDTPGIKVYADDSPLFRESTVVTSVTVDGDDIRIGVNNPAVAGAVWKNSSTVANSNAVSADNGKNESPFNNYGRRLKFTFAGDNLIVRDNLPLVHAALYDPSMLRDRIEYKISSASPASLSGEGNSNANGDSGGEFRVRFPRPSSWGGNFQRDGAKEIEQNSLAYDDSPLGLYVGNVFTPGQFVEYVTDASPDGSQSQGAPLVKEGQKTVFFVSKVDTVLNSISLKNIDETASDADNTQLNFKAFQNSSSPNAFTVGGRTTNHFIKTPVPFIFPTVYHTGTEGTDDVMFPYSRNFGVKYASGTGASQQTLTGNSHRPTGASGLTVGVLDTNLADAASGELSTTKFDEYKASINDINSGLICGNMRWGRTYAANNSTTQADLESQSFDRPGGTKQLTAGWRYWIEQNVKPEFWGVYEYKVPRSRFSFDSLNGESSEGVVYSDVIKDGGKTRYPGQTTIADTKTRDSLWDIDFANVIMKKIEFSWYGAVGALFLAYVPTGTGEARWVRVHHLRCSNQLKTASLGNATLPLTYTVYGGGLPKQYGRGALRTTGYASGKSVSEFITKYGSSYYIDGGDRGTVRLFNHSQPAASKITHSKFSETTVAEDRVSSDKFRITKTAAAGTNAANREDLYIGSTVTFDNSDVPARVTWIERKGNLQNKTDSPSARNASPTAVTVFLDRTVTVGTTANFIIDAPYNVFGITSKTSIKSSQDFLVRNRVQVYPTKLSTGLNHSGGQDQTVQLSLTKNVIFQPDTIFNIQSDERNNSLKFNGTDAALKLAGSGVPTRLTHSNVSPNVFSAATSTNAGPVYSNPKIGDEVYGWARLVPVGGSKQFTLFSKIKVVDVGASGSPVWDFIPEDTFTGEAQFVNNSLFTHAYQYNNNLDTTRGGIGRISSAVTQDTPEVARLSSVVINNEIRRAIPGTGTKVASLFLENGSGYFDLQPYFDYNKDYISFPLTNVPDNLFIGVKVDDTPHAANVSRALGTNTPKVAVSLTWEEQ